MFREDNARKNVIRKELLGTGSFGSVYRGDWLKGKDMDEYGYNCNTSITDVELHSSTNFNAERDVAIKIISYSGEQIEKLGRELYFLKKFNSPFTVKYFDSFLYHYELWIVMELCDAGSLLDLYRVTSKTLDESELRAVIACSVLGLEHIHNQLSIHRDIKAGNILLSSMGKAMLSDFGISARLKNTETKNRRKTVVGTPYWMAPEILLETAYGENVDVWSLGITVLELCEGRPPHSGVKPISAMFMTSYKPAPLLAEPERWSLQMQAFVSRCLVKDPTSRAQTRELAEHDWLQAEVGQLRSSQAAGEACSLHVLRELVKRHWDAITARRQKIDDDQVDTFSVDEDGMVEDSTETWDADKANADQDYARRTWNTIHFNESHFKGSPMNLRASQAPEDIHRESTTNHAAQAHVLDMPTTVGSYSAMTSHQASHIVPISNISPSKGGVKRVGNTHDSNDSNRSQHISTLRTMDTFIPNPSRKFSAHKDTRDRRSMSIHGRDSFPAQPPVQQSPAGRERRATIQEEDTVVITDLQAYRTLISAEAESASAEDTNKTESNTQGVKSSHKEDKKVSISQENDDTPSNNRSSIVTPSIAIEPVGVTPSASNESENIPTTATSSNSNSIMVMKATLVRDSTRSVASDDPDDTFGSTPGALPTRNSRSAFVVPQRFNEVVDRLSRMYGATSANEVSSNDSSSSSKPGAKRGYMSWSSGTTAEFLAARGTTLPPAPPSSSAAPLPSCASRNTMDVNDATDRPSFKGMLSRLTNSGGNISLKAKTAATSHQKNSSKSIFPSGK